MNNVINFFVPQSYKTDLKLYEHAALIVKATLAIFLLYPGYAIIYAFVFDFVEMTYAILASAAINTVGLLLLRSKVAPSIVSNISTLAVATMLIASLYMTGGLESRVILVLSMFPTWALLLGNMKSAWFWTFIASASAGTFYVMQLQGYEFPMLYDRSLDLELSLVGTSVPFLNSVFLMVLDSDRIEAFKKAARETELNRQACLQAEEAGKELEREKLLVEQKIQQAVNESQQQHEYLSTHAHRMKEAMEKFAVGDLTVSIPIENNGAADDVVQGIGETFNESVTSIRKLIEQQAEIIQQLSSISVQVASSSNEMAATSEQQSAQVVQIADSMGSMNHLVSTNTSKTESIAEIAQENGERAKSGERVVTKTIGKMEQIASVVSASTETVEKLGNSSVEIGEIVQVIDEIADQTNLLALNAAIEAARAGDQGKGFAVVADEVRKLAERTSQATKQIGTTIRQIQQETTVAVKSMQQGNTEVQEGLNLTHAVGNTLGQIIEGANEIASMVSDLAQSSREQAEMNDHMAQSVDQMSAAIQESATGTTEIAQNMEELDTLVHTLNNSVQSFQLQNGSQQQVLSHSASALIG